MSDSSPFDDAPESQYEDAPVDQQQHEEKEEQGEEEEEEEEPEQQEEDDPFADVPAPSAHSTQSSAPSLDAEPVEPEIEQETALRSHSSHTRSPADSLVTMRRSARSRRLARVDCSYTAGHRTAWHGVDSTRHRSLTSELSDFARQQRVRLCCRPLFDAYSGMLAARAIPPSALVHSQLAAACRENEHISRQPCSQRWQASAHSICDTIASTVAAGTLQANAGPNWPVLLPPLPVAVQCTVQGYCGTVD